mmetsp:Transcript_34102/g.78718  ORF Transcript_34102/g.78718 Transcript_34102/m.78718 type:complete len:574 (+) Transcript_34102:1219-2940(+)
MDHGDAFPLLGPLDPGGLDEGGVRDQILGRGGAAEGYRNGLLVQAAIDGTRTASLLLGHEDAELQVVPHHVWVRSFRGGLIAQAGDVTGVELSPIYSGSSANDLVSFAVFHTIAFRNWDIPKFEIHFPTDLVVKTISISSTRMRFRTAYITCVTLYLLFYQISYQSSGRRPHWTGNHGSDSDARGNISTLILLAGTTGHFNISLPFGHVVRVGVGEILVAHLRLSCPGLGPDVGEGLAKDGLSDVLLADLEQTGQTDRRAPHHFILFGPVLVADGQDEGTFERIADVDVHRGLVGSPEGLSPPSPRTGLIIGPVGRSLPIVVLALLPVGPDSGGTSHVAAGLKGHYALPKFFRDRLRLRLVAAVVLQYRGEDVRVHAAAREERLGRFAVVREVGAAHRGGLQDPRVEGCGVGRGHEGDVETPGPFLPSAAARGFVVRVERQSAQEQGRRQIKTQRIPVGARRSGGADIRQDAFRRLLDACRCLRHRRLLDRRLLFDTLRLLSTLQLHQPLKHALHLILLGGVQDGGAGRRRSAPQGSPRQRGREATYGEGEHEEQRRPEDGDEPNHADREGGG